MAVLVELVVLVVLLLDEEGALKLLLACGESVELGLRLPKSGGCVRASLLQSRVEAPGRTTQL